MVSLALWHLYSNHRQFSSSFPEGWIKYCHLLIIDTPIVTHPVNMSHPSNCHCRCHLWLHHTRTTVFLTCPVIMLRLYKCPNHTVRDLVHIYNCYRQTSSRSVTPVLMSLSVVPTVVAVLRPSECPYQRGGRCNNMAQFFFLHIFDEQETSANPTASSEPWSFCKWEKNGEVVRGGSRAWGGVGWEILSSHTSSVAKDSHTGAGDCPECFVVSPAVFSLIYLRGPRDGMAGPLTKAARLEMLKFANVGFAIGYPISCMQPRPLVSRNNYCRDLNLFTARKGISTYIHTERRQVGVTVTHLPTNAWTWLADQMYVCQIYIYGERAFVSR